MPQIAQLIEQEKLGEAYALAVQAERYIPDDPMLAKFWPAISWSGSINTTPPGVSVFRRNYNAPDNAWELVGRSPIEKRRFPLVDSQWKFELKGFATVERATFPSDSMTVTMDEEAKAPAGMVHVELPTSASPQSTPVRLFGLPGFEDSAGRSAEETIGSTNSRSQTQSLSGFSTKEVTRSRSTGSTSSAKDGQRAFLGGGDEIIPGHDGQARTRHMGAGRVPARAGRLSRDRRELVRGSRLRGVRGQIAAHYLSLDSCRLACRTAPASYLPAILAGRDPLPWGTYRGMSWSGAFDMAGNVKEWMLERGEFWQTLYHGWRLERADLYVQRCRRPLSVRALR